MSKTRIPMVVMSAMALGITSASAGDLDVVGNVTVWSNLTAQKVTLGGETRTNWPSGGAAGGAVELTTAVLDFTQPGQLFEFTLTNNVAWVFTNHVAGRQISLQLSQDATGGWTNTWPSGLLWPGGQRANGSTSPNHLDIFKILDNGQQWLALAEGLNYSTPCVSNCSYALRFDGAQNYVSVPASADFNPTGAFTYECWIKAGNVISGHNQVYASLQSGGEGGCSMTASLAEGGQLFWYWRNVDGSLPLRLDHGGHPDVLDGSWHHGAVTFDGTTAQMWVDGVEVDSSEASDSLTATSNVLSIGQGWHIGDNQTHFSGLVMDEFRISNAARYTGTFTPPSSFTVDSDTVAYYKFSEGIGTTAHDETSNHDLTLQGSPLPTWVEGN